MTAKEARIRRRIRLMERIRLDAEKHGMTLRELARQTGIAMTRMYALSDGSCRMTVEELHGISRALARPMEFFLREEDDGQ